MKNTLALKSVTHEMELVQRISQNDGEGYCILYNKYWNPLLNYASNYLHDEATCEEMVQGLFVHLYTGTTKPNINSSLSSYLFVALRNLIFNYLRDQALYKKHVTKAGYASAGSNNNVEQSINLMELQREIHFSLNRMPHKYKEVYLLREQDQWSIKRISQVLNRPIDTVEKQLRKARRLVRDHLRESKMHV